MEAQSLLSIEDKIQGFLEPDLDSFTLQGLDDIFIGIEKQIIISASAKDKGAKDAKLGGRWNANIQYGIENSVNMPVQVERIGTDSAVINHKFQLQGPYKIHISVSSIPVKGSPFTVNVQWGSSSQLDKWQTIDDFLKKDHLEAIEESFRYGLEQYDFCCEKMSRFALDYRNHLRNRIEFIKSDEKRERISMRLEKCILLKHVGSLLDDFPTLEGILVSHNSWMKWPEEKGYQARILSRLPEKEKKALIDKCTLFAKSRIGYGATFIFPVEFRSENKVIPKQLINTVTVIFVEKEKVKHNTQPFKNTKFDDLKTALGMALTEADKKGIKNMLIPSDISGNYFAGGKVEEAVLTIFSSWLAEHPETDLETLMVVHKEKTPKVSRRRKRDILKHPK